MSDQDSTFATAATAEPFSSPFSIVPDSGTSSSPFSAAAAAQSPFSAVPDDESSLSMQEPGKPAKIPPPRPQPVDRSARIYPDHGTPFGYDALAGGFPQHPSPPLPQSEHPSHAHGSSFGSAFGAAAQPPVAAYPQTPALSGSTPWHPGLASQIATPFALVAEPATALRQPEPAPSLGFSTLPLANSSYAPLPASAPLGDVQPAAHTQMMPPMQLELRAIFGLDRNLSAQEILQRCRTLPGIRNIVRINHQDVAALDNLKHNLASTGFAAGEMRLYMGNSPIEFISESNVTLAVVADGGFAPGIKETLIIAARELAKFA